MEPEVVPQVAKSVTPEPEPAEAEPEENVGGGEEEDADPIGFVIALYDFAGDGDDELPVKAGDRVEVYAEVEGWYTGTKDGRFGLVPKNFFSAITLFQ